MCTYMHMHMHACMCSHTHTHTHDKGCFPLWWKCDFPGRTLHFIQGQGPAKAHFSPHSRLLLTHFSFITWYLPLSVIHLKTSVCAGSWGICCTRGSNIGNCLVEWIWPTWKHPKPRQMVVALTHAPLHESYDCSERSESSHLRVLAPVSVSSTHIITHSCL